MISWTYAQKKFTAFKSFSESKPYTYALDILWIFLCDFSGPPILHKNIDGWPNMLAEEISATNQGLVDSVWMIHKWSQPTGQEYFL